MTKENNGWISVKDKLPESQQNVIIFNGFHLLGKFNGQDWITNGGLLGLRPVYGVTHWQPLPPRPQD
ncbi:DUF551 domain-containing protein [Actinobacillus pleuropneumoniae]|uniref:DUF551 domain-containing protein n=1 Tax=Actinobacillus pleuropneumoniae TaxID=715 RepID=A0A9Q4H6E0_ACTPL|nr:DUF551 domain-containing protein [Actinobacillus pleuropneumoniae]MCL7721947.1 DUF551 domain-containing protein [Actinobacillus pleuropneumoniae]MCL7726848.1 DUF551 domain-containing protein [Actinobacillus pleuropneumoniae]MCL7730347.1 DUF551 domain-containing protein [Actinobacillus pleuropneumoniae]MCY6367406.1 DUF551 domain-containing protein [Actinobacillus pleuropneumoniae]MCY6384272.1 DUF551 domain-containing protein [Actinobacillus pleuropneumoniae]